MFAFIVLLVAIIAISNKYNPVLQFHLIVGLGFLYLYDETDIEEGRQVIHQLLIGIVLFSITYVKPND
jgi:hypothetical protein